MSICWWGFSSTSRFRDVIPNDVKGETIHPERRLPASIRDRDAFWCQGSLVSPLFFAYSDLLALPFNNTSRLASIHRTGKLFHGGDTPPGFATESRDTDCTMPANRMSDNATHSDVTVDNLEFLDCTTKALARKSAFCEIESFIAFNGG